MPTPKSPMRVAMDVFLAERGSATIAELIAVIAPTVPPSVAVRRRRLDRERQSTTLHKEVPVSFEVQVGRRSEAYRTIHNAVAKGAYERDGDVVRVAR